MAFEILQARWWQMDRLHGKRTVSVEARAIESAKRRRHLVLRADRFLKDLLLEENRLAGELLLAPDAALEGVKSVKDSNGE